MLAALRGRAHCVVTGVALSSAAGLEWGAVVSTLVHMRPYTDAELSAYVDRGEPFDKAGGYAIQDPSFRPVAHISGCYPNVVGLPLCELSSLLSRFGVVITAEGIVCALPNGSPCPRTSG